MSALSSAMSFNLAAFFEDTFSDSTVYPFILLINHY